MKRFNSMSDFLRAMRQSSEERAVQITMTEGVFPDEFWEAARQLEALELNAPALEEIPDRISHLRSLQNLTMTYTRSAGALKRVSSEIGHLPDLEVLRIMVPNKLNSLPETVGRLSKLRILEIWQAQVQTFRLPETIGACQALEQLGIHVRLGYSWSGLQLPESLSKCKGIKKLSIEARLETSLPEDFWAGWQQLEHLSLNEIALSRLPASLGECTALKHFSCYNTPLTVFPDLREAPIETFILCGAAIRELPEWVGRWTSVQEVSLDRNELETLPETIRYWGAVRRLTLSQNRLKTLPEAIGTLSQLQRLVVSKNQLKQLPDVFGVDNMPYINDIHIDGNQLKELPESFKRLSSDSITAIRLGDNPWAVLPLFFLYWKPMRPLMGKQQMPYLKGILEGNSQYSKEAIPAYPRAFWSKAQELMNALGALNPDAAYVMPLYEVFCNDKKAMKQHDLGVLALALQSNSTILHDHAVAYWTTREAAKWQQKPIGKGSVVALLGDFFADTEVLLAQLAQGGIQGVKTWWAGVSHVLMGGGVSVAIAKEIPDTVPVGTTAQLKNILEQQQQLYLVEESKEAAQKQEQATSSAALSEMLLSKNADSVHVALEMLASGGVPAELCTDLFLVATLSAYDVGMELANKAEALLRVYGHESVLKILPENYRNMTKRLWQAFWKVIEAKRLDWQKVARHWDQSSVGYYPYYWAELPDTQLRLSVRAYIQRCEGRVYMNYWHDISFLYQFGDIIKELGIHKQNKHQIKGISKLVNLEVLSLRHCELGTLPEEIVQLPKLHRLVVSDNRLTSLPAILNSATQIKKIYIDGSLRHFSRNGLDKNLFEVQREGYSNWVLVRKE